MNISRNNSDLSFDRELREVAVQRKIAGWLENVTFELLPTERKTLQSIEGLLPKNSKIYVVDLPDRELRDNIDFYGLVLDMGYIPVPHVAARFIPDRNYLSEFLGELNSIGLHELLLIGGGLNVQKGEFKTVMELLETGLFTDNGIDTFGIAGHPEEHPYAGDEDIRDSYRRKYEFFSEKGLNAYVMTQFTFSPTALLKMVELQKSLGVHFPVKAGSVGLCGFSSLIKYSVMCGIGNSLSVLKKEMGNVLNLTKSYKTEKFFRPLAEMVIEAESRNDFSYACLESLHVFTFGNLPKTLEYLNNFR